MTIRLITLGGLRAIGDDGELDWLPGQRLRAALLVHLAVEGRVSRAALATVFWPDSDEAHARAALRQSLYHLRTVLGEGCLESVSHELRVGPRIQTDARTFAAALDRGDLAAAARLYDGPFLDGVHLVDLQLWEQWVDGRRAEYARRFRRACREWLDARRSAGDLAGALDAARCWAAPDPSDDEAQHRLIETLVDAGERAEALRQYEAYARLLEPEGLRPLDETVELMERARSSTTPWPTRQETPDLATDPVTPVPPSSAARGRSTRNRRQGLTLAGVGALVMLLSAFWFVQPRWSPEGNGAHPAGEGIDTGERIILADFDGPPADPALGAVVTDALRYELLATQSLRPVDRAEVQDVLARMQAAETRPLTADLAREVGLRHGVRALLEGRIAHAGTGYVLTAALRSTESGRVLAAFRETADSPDEVIPAIDRLSREVRRRAGRVLPSADTTATLERVTTASLDALRAYTQAERALQQRDIPRSTSLLADALELDPEFAMAWRLLAVTLGNTGLDRSRELEAATRAYELRHRLAPRERYLAVAGYHDRVTANLHATTEAYRRVLDLDPEDPVALNNLGLIHWRLGDLDTAAALLQSAADLPDAPPITYLNVVRTHLARARPQEAEAAAEALARRYPDHQATADARFWLYLDQGHDAGAVAALRPLLDDPARPPADRALAHDRMARLALWRGRIEEARTHLDAAERAVRMAGPPYDPFAWRLSRAHAEAAVGDPELGVRLLRQPSVNGVMEGTAPAERLRAFQAAVLATAGRGDEAEAALRGLEDDGSYTLRGQDRARIGLARGLVHLLRGEAVEAVATLESARDAGRCRACFAAAMGHALREAGRLDEAVQEWEAALVGTDAFDDAGLQLADRLWTLQRLPALYEELGDTVGALGHYRELVRLWHDADPEIRPRVEQARARIVALTGG